MINNLNLMDEDEPLTTIVGVKCHDGIVLTSDSQAEGRIKSLGVTKVFVLKDFMALGGSGDADSIRLFKDAAETEFTQILPTETCLKRMLKGCGLVGEPPIDHL